MLIDPEDEDWDKDIKVGGSIFVNNRRYYVHEIKRIPAMTMLVNSVDGGDCKLTLFAWAQFHQGIKSLRYLYHYSKHQFNSAYVSVGWLFRKPGSKTFQITDKTTPDKKSRQMVEVRSDVAEPDNKLVPGMKVKKDGKILEVKTDGTLGDVQVNPCKCGARYKRIGKMLWCPNCKQHFKR